MARYITTHGAALRLAVRTLNDKIELMESQSWTQYATTLERGEQIVQNYRDARDVIESDLLGDEWDYEIENGFRVGDRFYPNGDAPMEEES